jgi:hypothetical protein
MPQRRPTERRTGWELWEAKTRIPKGFAKSTHFRHIIGL